MYQYKDTLDYSDQGMHTALSYEKTLKEFFFKVKDFSRDVKFDNPDAFRKVTDNELQLLATFHEKKTAIHRALCDSINTPAAMKEITNLISTSNTYMNSFYNSPDYNHVLVKDIAGYITNLLKVKMAFLNAMS